MRAAPQPHDGTSWSRRCLLATPAPPALGDGFGCNQLKQNCLKSVSTFLNLSQLVSTCLDLCQLVSTCVNFFSSLSQLVSTCVNLSCLNLSQPVLTCLNLSQLVSTLSQLVSTCLNLSICVTLCQFVSSLSPICVNSSQLCLNLSQLVSTCLNVFQLVSTCLNSVSSPAEHCLNPVSTLSQPSHMSQSRWVGVSQLVGLGSITRGGG